MADRLNHPTTLGDGRCSSLDTLEEWVDKAEAYFKDLSDGEWDPSETGRIMRWSDLYFGIRHWLRFLEENGSTMLRRTTHIPRYFKLKAKAEHALDHLKTIALEGALEPDHAPV